VFCPDRLFRSLCVSIAILPLLAAAAFADSQARTVRLSEVDGDVKVDRNAGQGTEKAFLNLPIIQGAKIATGKTGRAEVEFEDGSTLHLAPDTIVTVTQLSLRDSGAKVSALHLQEGIVYVNIAGSKIDEFAMTFGRETLSLKSAAHLRVLMGDTDATVAVFKGEAEVSGGSGSVQVAKGHTVDFDLIDKDKYTTAKEIVPEPFDDWDNEQAQYHERYMSAASAPSASPYAYGTSDLNYYGAYSSVPGYGLLWQPYLVGSGWDPFMSGAWAFYPGAGYAWVSGYPWGWTPYHSGNWAFVPGYGWGWQPGNWSGWSLTGVTNAPSGFQMPQAPSSGHGTIRITRGPEPSQMGRSGSKLSIPQNSAGLGLPRGSIKNFGELSQAVQKSGVVSTRLHVEPVGEAAVFWRSQYPGRSGMVARPSAGMSLSSRAGQSSSAHVGSSSGHTSK
jgi:hypothetical protein